MFSFSAFSSFFKPKVSLNTQNSGSNINSVRTQPPGLNVGPIKNNSTETGEKTDRLMLSNINLECVSPVSKHTGIQAAPPHRQVVLDELQFNIGELSSDGVVESYLKRIIHDSSDHSLTVPELRTAIKVFNTTLSDITPTVEALVGILQPGSMVMNTNEYIVFVNVEGKLEFNSKRIIDQNTEVDKVKMMKFLCENGVSASDDETSLNEKIRALSQTSEYVDLMSPLRNGSAVLVTPSFTVSVNESESGMKQLVIHRNGINFAPLDFRNKDIPTFTSQQIQDLIRFFESHIESTRYNQFVSTMHVLESASQKDVSFRDASHSFLPDIKDLIRRYKGGGCKDLAQDWKNCLKKIGINSYIIGQRNEGLEKFPGNNGQQKICWKELIEYSEGVTHADLIVPYRDEDGQEHILQFKTGMGKDANLHLKQDERGRIDYANPLGDYKIEYKKNPTHVDIYNGFDDGVKLLRMKMYTLDPESEGEILNPKVTSYRASKFKTSIFLHKHGTPKLEMLGIDLLNGEIFINSEGSRSSRFDLSMSEPDNKPKKIVINYRQILKDPDKEVQIYSKDGSSMSMTNKEYLLRFIATVASEFDMDGISDLRTSITDDMPVNLLMLLEHEREYIEDVLLSPAASYVETKELRDNVDSVLKSQNAASLDSSIKAELESLFNDAYKLVVQDRPDDANKIYSHILDYVNSSTSHGTVGDKRS